MSNEDRGPSPADGPAKVFGREPLPTSAMPGEATHILALENLCFQWFAGNGVYLDADKDSSGNAEALAMATLSALLSLIPPEQAVQAMGEETRPGMLAALLRASTGPGYWEQLENQRDEAIARAERAEANAAASWQFAELARVKAKEAGDRAFRASERANSAERERDAMHAAAEELRAQGAVLPEAHSGRTSRRPYVTTHDDETLLEWWNGDRKLSVYIDDGGIRALKVGPGAEIVDVELALGGWAAARDWLNGTGRKTEESDGKQEDEKKGGGPVRGVEALAGERKAERPAGVPASATIWAEVVDGLGRKVGAWFEPPFMKGDLGHVDMYDPEQPSAPWAWSPRCDSQWKGSFDERLTPSAAAQCRQLYERGMAAEKARLIEVSSGNLPPIEVPDVFGMLSDRLGYTKPARPACIPSHIPDTDWTVIEGRAVWREDGLLRIEDRTGATFGGWLCFQHNTYESLRGMQRDVPQSLFLAARRWMGWEKEETEAAKQPGQTPERYRPKTDVQKLGKLVEECGEVLAAAGKTMRWGLDSTNPELPPEQQETNAAWLARELYDLEEAIGFAREVLAAHEGGAP